MELKYSLQIEDENTIAKAMLRDVNISFKHAVVVCDKLRGLSLKKAKSVLEDTMAFRKPLPFRKFNTGIGHRSGDEKIAKYPQKACQEILTILKNLETNAEYKGLDSDKLRIIHLQAQQGISRKRRRPKGRYKLWRTQLVTIQALAKED